MELDLTSLRDATARLEEMLAQLQQQPVNEAFRDSLVKRFEFTYEIFPPRALQSKVDQS